MFSCIVDDAVMQQQAYETTTITRYGHDVNSNANNITQANNMAANVDEQAREIKDMKKRIRRVSALLAETETQRCAERMIYERDTEKMKHDWESANLEVNTAHMIEITQVNKNLYYCIHII